MLSKVCFDKYIAELEEHFNKKLSDFARAIYYKKLENLEDTEFVSGVANALSKYPCGNFFFPSAEQVKELALGGISENRSAYKVAGALPSAEARMSEEECIENRRKLYKMIKGVGSLSSKSSSKS